MREIRVQIHLLPAHVGRHRPIGSGYRPPFYFGEYQTDGVIYLVGRERLMPGEHSEATVKLLHPEHLGSSLHAKATFDFREGAKVVGQGRVLEILEKH